MVCPPSGGSCLPFYPSVSLLVSLCWMVCPPSRGLVSPCLPLSPLVSFLGQAETKPREGGRTIQIIQQKQTRRETSGDKWRLGDFLLLDAVSAFRRVLPPFVSHLVSPGLPLYPFLFPFVGWCVRLPEGLVSPFIPVSPFLCPFVGWCVRLPGVLSPLVSPCLPLSPLVSPCLLSWTSGDKTSRRRMHHPNHPTKANKKGDQRRQVETRGFPSVGWCVRLPIVSPHVCLCWMVRPPSRGLVSPCLPLSPRVCACVGCCVYLPEVLSPIVSACLQLSPHMCACVGCCVYLPEVLSPTVSPHVCLCWMVRPPCQGFIMFYRPLSPIVVPHMCLCWMVCPPSRGLVSHCLRLSPIVSPHVCLCWMVCPPSRRLVSPCLPLFPLAPHIYACVRWFMDNRLVCTGFWLAGARDGQTRLCTGCTFIHIHHHHHRHNHEQNQHQEFLFQVASLCEWSFCWQRLSNVHKLPRVKASL